MPARIVVSRSARRAIATSAIASSTTEFVMRICSLAARKRSRSSASRVTSQPIRMPGRPSAFDSDETLMTRSDRVAATGCGPPNVISRYVSSMRSRAWGWASTRSTMARIEVSGMTWPVGLCGFVSETSLVRGVSMAAIRSGSTAQPSSYRRSR